ncbi:hypothetical protein [Microbacterium thalli]|uniref:hypothetical protein n=1 Tax=Microbacterium thalli TaxID=3027921 RepID=UPI002365B6DF|nr:hypothetical protein [Microbacterium thalli]MDD7929749.1 hypothetical protein [Microbacterium thalli]
MSSAPSRSNPLPRAIEDAVDTVLGLVVPGMVIVVDGRSGAGKTTFAREVLRRWPADVDVEPVALDDLYPGWDGLVAGSAYAYARVLAPRLERRAGTWQRWDWNADRYGDVRACPPERAVILEGSGALTPASAALSSVRVWLDAPASVRRERALARDGETYRPHWERWALQEDEHVARHDPRALATHIVELA